MSPRAKTRTPREMSDILYGIGRGPGWFKRCTRCSACYPSHQVKCPCSNSEFEIVETDVKQNTIATTFANGLKFDAEFRDLIEPPTPEELAQLAANLLRDNGARDPVAVWKGHEIVLDGHNRVEICEDNELPYPRFYVDLPDRDACKAWIASNQLGRRNLSPARMDYLRGKKFEFEKGKRGGKKIPASGSKVQTEPLVLLGDDKVKAGGGKLPDPQESKPNPKPTDVATRIAEETGTSRATVKRNATFAKAVDRLANHAPDLRQELISGKLKISNKAARQIVAMKPIDVITMSRIMREERRDADVVIRGMVRRRFFGIEAQQAPENPVATKPVAATVVARKTNSPPPDTDADKEAWSTVVNRLKEILTYYAKVKGAPITARELAHRQLKELLSFAEGQL